MVALATIVRKEVTRFLRIWSQTLLPSAITMTLYFIVFGSFIGSQIQDMHGFSYMSFIAPGLIMMAIITNAYSNVVSSFFGSKFMKNIEEILVSPTSTWVIVLGYTAGGVLRGLMVGAIVTVISLFFTNLVIHNLFYVIAYALLTALVFSLAGLLNAIYAKKFDDVSIVPTFVLTPLTYLGGVFYPLSVLPIFWQKLSLANPLLYMITGFRHGFLGIKEVHPLFGLGLLSILGIILFILNLHLINKGVGLRN